MVGSIPVATTIAHVAMILIAATAATIDHRTGRIPNWLTLPVVFLAPLLWLLVSVDAALASVAAVFVCGGIPYIAFRMDAIGGGDVKLFAALGGLGGLVLGIEAQMFSLVAAVVFLFIVLALKGKLAPILKNTGRMVVNGFLPKHKRTPIKRAELHEIRLGPAILAGTIVAVVTRYGGL